VILQDCFLIRPGTAHTLDTLLRLGATIEASGTDVRLLDAATGQTADMPSQSWCLLRWQRRRVLLVLAPESAAHAT
jgi:hypothetical protein